MHAYLHATQSRDFWRKSGVETKNFCLCVCEVQFDFMCSFSTKKEKVLTTQFEKYGGWFNLKGAVHKKAAGTFTVRTKVFFNLWLLSSVPCVFLNTSIQLVYELVWLCGDFL